MTKIIWKVVVGPAAQVIPSTLSQAKKLTFKMLFLEGRTPIERAQIPANKNEIWVGPMLDEIIRNELHSQIRILFPDNKNVMIAKLIKIKYLYLGLQW